MSPVGIHTRQVTVLVNNPIRYKVRGCETLDVVVIQATVDHIWLRHALIFMVISLISDILASEHFGALVIQIWRS